mgnify:FL=1
MNEILTKLNPIFKDILDQDDLEISRESNAQNTEDWDSLAHINLITSIEKEFDIRFNLGELEDLKNVGEMIDLIEIKLSH